MENIDIKFIAKKSECSIATVSRVINRSKPVSEELQKRVIDTIRKYNYNPSIYAQNYKILIQVMFHLSPKQLQQKILQTIIPNVQTKLIKSQPLFAFLIKLIRISNEKCLLCETTVHMLKIAIKTEAIAQNIFFLSIKSNPLKKNW